MKTLGSQATVAVLAIAISAPGLALANEAPGSVSSDTIPSQGKVELGKGSLRMHKTPTLDASVARYSSSGGEQGYALGIDARKKIYVNGTHDIDGASGVLFEPGVKARVTVDSADYRIRQAEVDLSAGSVYGTQWISGSGIKRSQRDIEYLSLHQAFVNAWLARDAANTQEERASREKDFIQTRRALVSKNFPVKEPDGGWGQSFVMERDTDLFTRLDLAKKRFFSREAELAVLSEIERSGLSSPEYQSIHGTYEIKFITPHGRLSKDEKLGTETKRARVNGVELSAHGALTVEGINVDLCVLAELGASGGSIRVGEFHDQELALHVGGSICLGVAAGAVGHLSVEAGFDSDRRNATFTQKFVTTRLRKVGGYPFSIGYEYNVDSVSGGDSEAWVGRHFITVSAAR